MRESMLVVLAAAVSFACSPSDPAPGAPPPPGCDQVALNGTCFARAGLTAAQCSFGTFRAEGCPRVDAVGTCVDAQAEETTYYSPTYNAYVAHYFCDLSGGSWIGTGAPTVSASCDERATVGTCTDASGPQDEMDVVLPYCTGTVSSSPCPVTGRTGTCSSVMAGLTVHDRFYDGATVDADAAACVADGDTWTAG